MRIVLLGPPGAGKGTQAVRIAAQLDCPHIATGDIFRANVAEETALGLLAREYMDRGDLVPDDVVIAMVLERLAEPDCADGFILDGFPRTVGQAEALDQRLAAAGTPLDAVLCFKVGEDELLRRLAGRAAEQRRTDDDEATIRRRLEVFASTTRRLLDYYAHRGLLAMVDALGDIDVVTRRVLAALELEPAAVAVDDELALV